MATLRTFLSHPWALELRDRGHGPNHHLLPGADSHGGAVPSGYTLYGGPSKSEARRRLLVSSLEAPPRSSLEGVFLSVEPDERKPP